MDTIPIHSIPTGRLAPSPTGALHLGNARTFLIAWLSIRSRHGRLILRMEDLDHPKVKPGTARAALDDLRWLGLDWDEGPDIGGPHAPYTQTERTPGYAAALQKLLQQNLVYPCTCSRQDVTQGQSAPHADGELFYPGTCRGRFPTYAAAEATLPPGRLPAWRFRVDPGTHIHFTDGFAGPVSQCVDQTSGDFVIARDPDGAGYMLAVVVDDAAMGITEVVRGNDLLPATPRQLLLYRALDLPPPQFIHLPLVVAEDGRRLAKRYGDTRLSAIRGAGVPPEEVLGVLAWWSGLAAWGESPTLSTLLTRYDPARIPHTPAVLTAAVRRRLRVA